MVWRENESGTLCKWAFGSRQLQVLGHEITIEMGEKSSGGGQMNLEKAVV